MKKTFDLSSLKTFSFCVLILVSFRSVYAQTHRAENVSIASPNAAALGKVADIPVNYHTGIPSIGIPIYTIKEGSLQLPISLSYHASGLKVMEQASWVGAGWSLNAGGVITRSVRGNADESSNGNQHYYLHSPEGYYSYLYREDQVIPRVLDYQEFMGGLKDGEPDLFFFNFGGYSGKFYFRPDRTAVLIPQQDIKIKGHFCDEEPGGCSTNEPLFGWTITTPDGVQYRFGKTTTTSEPGYVHPIEQTQTYSVKGGLTFSKTISSWYLDKIVSPDGLHEINLTYANEEYGFYTVSMFPTTGGGDVMDLVKNLIYGVRLSSISFSNGTVNFIPHENPRQDLSSTVGAPPLFDYDNTNAKALKQIRITGEDFDKTFEFAYDYFVDNQNLLQGTYDTGVPLESTYNIHTDKKRLKLLSVQEKATDNSFSVPPHVFSYYDETSVPRTLSLAQDHWGYYNGATTNDDLVPPLSLDGGYTFTAGEDANRESSWPEMRSGALQRIKYPTGGTSEFTYNSHDVWVQKTSIEVKPGGINQQLNSNVSSEYLFTLNTTTPFKITTAPLNTSQQPPCEEGSVHINNFTTNEPIAPIGTPSAGSTHVRSLSPGNYKFSLNSADSRIQCPIAATLTELYTYQRWEQVVVGGLRIENIATTNGIDNTTLNRTFNYQSSGMSQGVLFGRPTYISLIRNERNAQSGVFGGINENGEFVRDSGTKRGCIVTAMNDTTYASVLNDTTYAYIISPSSVHPMRTTQGNHIGYNQVVVTEPDGGATVYNYRYHSNAPGDVSNKVINQKVCDASIPNYPPAPEPLDFDRGELVNVGMYNAGGILLKENKYDTHYNFEPVGITALIVKGYPNALGYALATEYELKTAKKTKTTELEWTYDPSTLTPSAGKITETFYESPNHAFTSRTIVSEAAPPSGGGTEIGQVVKGKVLAENKTTYVADVTIPSCNPAYTLDDSLLDELSQLYATYLSTKNGCQTFHCKYMAWLDYTEQVNEARMTYSTSRSTYYSDLEDCMELKADDNTVSTDLKALLVLRNRNQIQGVIESSQWRNGNFLGSTFIKYGQFEANQSFIYPANTQVINVSSPKLATYFTPLSFSNTDIAKDSKYTLEETYQRKDGFVSEIIAKDGVVTSYIWNTQTKLPIVKVVGVSHAVLLAAYTAAQGNLNTLRSQASLSKAMITTYSHTPLLGVKSITDPNSFSTSYEYDPLGRLALVKDSDENIVKRYEYHYKQ